MTDQHAKFAYITFSNFPMSRPLKHNLVNECFTIDVGNKRCTLLIERRLDVPLEHYQGASIIGLQIDANNDTTYSAVGGKVMGNLRSDVTTVRLELVCDRLNVCSPCY